MPLDERWNDGVVFVCVFAGTRTNHTEVCLSAECFIIMLSFVDLIHTQQYPWPNPTKCSYHHKLPWHFCHWFYGCFWRTPKIHLYHRFKYTLEKGLLSHRNMCVWAICVDAAFLASMFAFRTKLRHRHAIACSNGFYVVVVFIPSHHPYTYWHAVNHFCLFLSLTPPTISRISILYGEYLTMPLSSSKTQRATDRLIHFKSTTPKYNI